MTDIWQQTAAAAAAAAPRPAQCFCITGISGGHALIYLCIDTVVEMVIIGVELEVFVRR